MVVASPQKGPCYDENVIIQEVSGAPRRLSALVGCPASPSPLLARRKERRIFIEKAARAAPFRAEIKFLPAIGLGMAEILTLGLQQAGFLPHAHVIAPDAAPQDLLVRQYT